MGVRIVGVGMDHPLVPVAVGMGPLHRPGVPVGVVGVVDVGVFVLQRLVLVDVVVALREVQVEPASHE